jgi:hypothetical protein
MVLKFDGSTRGDNGGSPISVVCPASFKVAFS